MNDKQKLLSLEQRLDQLEKDYKSVEKGQRQIIGQLLRIADCISKLIKQEK